ETLDVQNYPDLRQYPGGPPERPYDAAGWTLPLQMDVKVMAAATPLAADVRAAMKALSPPVDPKLKPSIYESSTASDAATLDSARGRGFDTEGGAAAIVPPEGRVTGAGPALALSAAQNNAFRAINQAWKAGGSVQFNAGRYVIAGLSETAQADLVRSLALI